MLIILSWILHVLVLTSIPANTPYDVGGSYAVQLHTWISLWTGALVAETTGRTLAMLKAHGSILDMLFMLPPWCFAFSFAVLFGLGSLYASSGALRGLSIQPLLCSTVLALFILVGTYHVQRFRT